MVKIADVPTWKWMVGVMGSMFVLTIPVVLYVASVASSSQQSAEAIVGLRADQDRNWDASREFAETGRTALALAVADLKATNDKIAAEMRTANANAESRIVRLETYGVIQREADAARTTALARIEAKGDKADEAVRRIEEKVNELGSTVRELASKVR